MKGLFVCHHADFLCPFFIGCSLMSQCSCFDSPNPVVFLGYVTSSPKSRDYRVLTEKGRAKVRMWYFMSFSMICGGKPR